jgi:hypothetical protein
VGTIVKRRHAYVLKAADAEYLLYDRGQAKQYKGKRVKVTGNSDENHVIRVRMIQLSLSKWCAVSLSPRAIYCLNDSKNLVATEPAPQPSKRISFGMQCRQLLHDLLKPDLSPLVGELLLIPMTPVMAVNHV